MSNAQNVDVWLQLMPAA